MSSSHQCVSPYLKGSRTPVSPGCAGQGETRVASLSDAERSLRPDCQVTSTQGKAAGRGGGLEGTGWTRPDLRISVTVGVLHDEGGSANDPGDRGVFQVPVAQIHQSVKILPWQVGGVPALWCGKSL
jgi:hypothetical protein